MENGKSEPRDILEIELAAAGVLELVFYYMTHGDVEVKHAMCSPACISRY